jgi:hypothetical protein
VAGNLTGLASTGVRAAEVVRAALYSSSQLPLALAGSLLAAVCCVLHKAQWYSCLLADCYLPLLVWLPRMLQVMLV